MSENRQFVVRVLDVAQGAGALLQVDDQPPRWLSTDDALAVDVPKPSPDAVLMNANAFHAVRAAERRLTRAVEEISETKPDCPEPKGSRADYRQVSRSEAGLTWSPRDNIDHSHASDLSAWSSYNHTRREFVNDAVEPEKAAALERWNGWSDEELDRLSQMLGDGGHELADLQAERRRRHAEAQHCCVHDWDVVEHDGVPVVMVCADCGAKRKVVDE